MHTFDELYHPAVGVDNGLRPLLERLYQCLTMSPLDPPAIKQAIVAVLAFLASPKGRTDANCRAVDSFLMQDEAWDADGLPQAFVDILTDMSGALHDTVSASDVARNFDSTPEQLLERANRM
jgi:hypothetical protein